MCHQIELCRTGMRERLIMFPIRGREIECSIHTMVLVETIVQISGSQPCRVMTLKPIQSKGHYG